MIGVTRGKEFVATLQETGGRRQASERTSKCLSEFLSAASSLLKRSAVLAILIFPLFAHGCHREDIDNEPGFIPPTHFPTAESPK